MSMNRARPKPPRVVRHGRSRVARKEIGKVRTKGTIYHYGPISKRMAYAYIKALMYIKPAFRTKGWYDQLGYFFQFV